MNRTKKYFLIILAILTHTSISSFATEQFSATRTVSPNKINVKGGGHDTATVTLTINAPTTVTKIYKPQDVIMLFDVSGSMNTQKLSGAKTAGKTFADSLSSDCNISLWQFSYGTQIKNIVPFSKDKALIKNKIDGLVAGGGTYMNTAIMQVLNYSKQAENKPPVIIVLTDGAASDQNLFAQALDSAINTNKKDNLRIFTIAFGTTGLDTNTLKTYADSTNGKFYYSPTNEKLVNVFKNIAYSINSTVAIEIDKKIPMLNDVLPPWIEYIPNSQKVSITGGNIYNINGFSSQYVNTSLGVSQKLSWNIPTINASNIITITYKIQALSSGELSTEITQEGTSETTNYGKILYKGATENEYFEFPFPDAKISIETGFSKFGFLITPRENYVGDSILVRLVAMDNNNNIITDYNPSSTIILNSNIKQLFVTNNGIFDEIKIHPEDFNLGYSKQYILKNSDTELTATLFAIDSISNNIVGRDSAKWTNNPLAQNSENYKIYIIRKNDYNPSYNNTQLKALSFKENDTITYFLNDSIGLIAIGIDDSTNKKTVLNVDWNTVGYMNNSNFDFSKINLRDTSINFNLGINDVEAIGTAITTTSLLNQYGLQKTRLFIKIVDPINKFKLYIPEIGIYIDSTFNDTTINIRFSSPYSQTYAPFIITDKGDTLYIKTLWNIPSNEINNTISNSMTIYYQDADSIYFEITRNGYKINFSMQMHKISNVGVYPNPISFFNYSPPTNSNTNNTNNSQTKTPTFFIKETGKITKINLVLFDGYGNFVQTFNEKDFTTIKQPSEELTTTYICDKWDGKNYHNNKINSGNYYAVFYFTTENWTDKNGEIHKGDNNRLTIKFYTISED